MKKNCKNADCSALDCTLSAQKLTGLATPSDLGLSISFENKFDILIDSQGLVVKINEQFYHSHVQSRFFHETADLNLSSLTLYETDYECKSARFVFCQMKNSLIGGETSELYYESKVLELVFRVLTIKKQARVRSLTESDKKAVESAKQIIQSHLNDCPKICELAKLVHTSTAKLQADFKTAYGCTLHDFMQSRRVIRAAELLTSTQKPIYEIAHAVGCKKAGRFSKIFRAAYGVSPSEFRQIDQAKEN